MDRTKERRKLIGTKAVTALLCISMNIKRRVAAGAKSSKNVTGGGTKFHKGKGRISGTYLN